MRAAALFLCLTLTAAGQTSVSSQQADLSQLNFLLGTWSARTVPIKGAPATILGEYTFRTDLLNNVVTRVSDSDNCASAKAADCRHYDALTVYRDPDDPVLHALYLDSQGHTIHYNLAFPDPSTAIFFSTGPGTQTRLVYHVQKNILTGRLQTAPPGTTNFTSTLDWFGVRISQAASQPTAQSVAMSAMKLPATAHPLDALTDNARILFVAATQSADPNFSQQLRLLEPLQRDLADRNLILIPLLALWTPADKALYDHNVPFSVPEEQRYARARYRIPATTFTVVLIGKDGGEKLRSSAPLTPQKLFSTIDAMPMRREEMKKR